MLEIVNPLASLSSFSRINGNDAIHQRIVVETITIIHLGILGTQFKIYPLRGLRSSYHGFLELTVAASEYSLYRLKIIILKINGKFKL
jgi:hypothetical protein